MQFDILPFSIFTFFIILFSIIVIISRNPIYSLFCLILVFINTAILLFYFKVEFIALILLIVYAGAISVLFLFIVLLLNIKNIESTENTSFFETPITALVSIKFFIVLTLPVYFSFKNYNSIYKILLNDSIVNLNFKFFSTNSDLYFFGNMLYSHYSIFLIISGLILLVAMIGTISLTKKV